MVKDVHCEFRFIGAQCTFYFISNDPEIMIAFPDLESTEAFPTKTYIIVRL